MKTLYLIDGYSLMYTSFFAGVHTGLSSPSGESTYGTFIFTKTILRILETYDPDMVCAAMDGPHETFRKKLYEGYKNNRKGEKPEDLFPQVNRMKQILECMGFPVYYAPGFEADDVIATIVEKADTDLLITICSKDKDLLQLIDEKDRVSVLDPYKNSRMYSEEVYEKYAIYPSQFLDYQGLVGDTSDNIPGIKGIGPKTAVKFLKEFGTGNNMYEGIMEKSVLSKTDLKILEGYDSFTLSRSLAMLRSDVAIDICFDDMERRELNWSELNPLFEELGFDSLMKKIRFGNRELA
jgi:DNA polymerase-1